MGSVIMYFLKNNPLNWSDSQFDYMTSFGLLAASFGFLAFTPLLKLIRFRDTGITIVGISFLITRQILLAYSTTDFMVYICKYLVSVTTP